MKKLTAADRKKHEEDEYYSINLDIFNQLLFYLPKIGPFYVQTSHSSFRALPPSSATPHQFNRFNDNLDSIFHKIKSLGAIIAIS